MKSILLVFTLVFSLIPTFAAAQCNCSRQINFRNVDLDSLIERLGSDRFHVRERARMAISNRLRRWINRPNGPDHCAIQWALTKLETAQAMAFVESDEDRYTILRRVIRPIRRELADATGRFRVNVTISPGYEARFMFPGTNLPLSAPIRTRLSEPRTQIVLPANVDRSTHLIRIWHNGARMLTGGRQTVIIDLVEGENNIRVTISPRR